MFSSVVRSARRGITALPRQAVVIAQQSSPAAQLRTDAVSICTRAGSDTPKPLANGSTEEYATLVRQIHAWQALPEGDVAALHDCPLFNATFFAAINIRTAAKLNGLQRYLLTGIGLKKIRAEEGMRYRNGLRHKIMRAGFIGGLKVNLSGPNS